jgi:hypothetical protein
VIDTTCQVTVSPIDFVNKMHLNVSGPPMVLKEAAKNSRMEGFRLPGLPVHCVATPFSDYFILGLDFMSVHRPVVVLPLGCTLLNHVHLPNTFQLGAGRTNDRPTADAGRTNDRSPLSAHSVCRLRHLPVLVRRKKCGAVHWSSPVLRPSDIPTRTPNLTVPSPAAATPPVVNPSAATITARDQVVPPSVDVDVVLGDLRYLFRMPPDCANSFSTHPSHSRCGRPIRCPPHYQ